MAVARSTAGDRHRLVGSDTGQEMVPAARSSSDSVVPGREQSTRGAELDRIRSLPRTVIDQMPLVA